VDLPKARSITSYSLWFVVPDLLFVLLPLFVLLIVMANEYTSTKSLLESPEWSFAAAILYGQSVFKWMAAAVDAIGSGDDGRRWAPSAGVVATIIVLGLVPSLVILSLVLTNIPPGRRLVALQISEFLGGVVAFVGTGVAIRILLKGGAKTQ